MSNTRRKSQNLWKQPCQYYVWWVKLVIHFTSRHSACKNVNATQISIVSSNTSVSSQADFIWGIDKQEKTWFWFKWNPPWSFEGLGFNFVNKEVRKTMSHALRSNPANIRLDEDVLKKSWRRLSSSYSEGVLIKTNIFALIICLQKISWSRSVYLSWSYVFKKFLRDVLCTAKAVTYRRIWNLWSMHKICKSGRNFSSFSFSLYYIF